MILLYIYGSDVIFQGWGAIWRPWRSSGRCPGTIYILATISPLFLFDSFSFLFIIFPQRLPKVYPSPLKKILCVLVLDASIFMPTLSFYSSMQGYTSPKRENTLSVGYVPVLSKFASSSCFTQQRLGKKCGPTESCQPW